MKLRRPERGSRAKDVDAAEVFFPEDSLEDEILVPIDSIDPGIPPWPVKAGSGVLFSLRFIVNFRYGTQVKASASTFMWRAKLSRTTKRGDRSEPPTWRQHRKFQAANRRLASAAVPAPFF